MNRIRYIFLVSVLLLIVKIFPFYNCENAKLTSQEIYELFIHINDVNQIVPFIDFFKQRALQVQIEWLKFFTQRNCSFFWRLYLPMIEPCKFEQDDWVRCCDFGINNTFVTGSDSGELSLFDINTCKCLIKTQAHNDVINCVSFCPNNQIFAVGSEDGYISLYSAADLTLIVKESYKKSPVTALEWVHGSTYLVVGYLDGTIAVLDRAENKVFYFHGHDGEVSSIISMPVNANPLFVSASHDNFIKVWSLGDNILIKQFHYLSKNGLACPLYIQPLDSEKFICTSNGMPPILYNLENGLCSLADFFKDDLKRAVVCPDGNLALLNDTGRVYWANFSNIYSDFWQSHVEKVHSLIFSKDGRHALVGAKSKTVFVWSIEKILHELSIEQILLLIFWNQEDPEDKIKIFESEYWKTVFAEYDSNFQKALLNF